MRGRRVLVDEYGRVKTELASGEHKSLQTDRVILQPGPPEEVETVRRLYRMFVVQQRSESEIADVLNGEGLRTDLGRKWTRGTVHQILTNEKYIGNNVYNRISYKLKAKRVNEEFTVALVIARCHVSPAGGMRWQVRFDSGLRPDLTIAVRMEDDNRKVRDYYLFPWLDLNQTPKLRLAPDNGILLDAFRYDTLDAFIELTRRTSLRKAA